MSHDTGSIELIMGPMFAGKSTQLSRSLFRHTIAKRKAIIIRPNIDTRGDKNHGGDLIWGHKPEVNQLIVTELSPLIESAVSAYDVVGIDEIQFFNGDEAYPEESKGFDIVHFCKRLVLRGKSIILSSLNGDFKREPFPVVSSMIPHCDIIHKLSAVCVECGSDANFTHRKVENNNSILVGGANYYEALCRRCFEQKNNHETLSPKK